MRQVVFEIKKNPVDKYFFVLKDKNGELLVTSSSFSGRAQLEKCLSYVRETMQLVKVSEDNEALEEMPMLRINSKNGGEFDFSLFGLDGLLIFTSERFHCKEECFTAIEVLKKQSLDAGIYDTILQNNKY